MEMNGTYKLIYTVNDIEEELLVEVQLKPNDVLLKEYNNVYYGTAYVNGSILLQVDNKIDISHSVNAKFAAEEIGLVLKEELKKKYRKEGKSFRVKKEIKL